MRIYIPKLSGSLLLLALLVSHCLAFAQVETDSVVTLSPDYVNYSGYAPGEPVLRNATYDGDYPVTPSPPRLVNDFASLMPDSVVKALEGRLVAFDDSTTFQICVVTLPSLFGHEPAEYSHHLFELWGIGHADANNGVLLLVKPKTSESNGQVFITTGYGVEPFLPDITCNHITRDDMLPFFMAGDYPVGIVAGVKGIIRAIYPEYESLRSHDHSLHSNVHREWGADDWCVFLFFFLVIPLLVGYIVHKRVDMGKKEMGSLLLLGVCLVYGYRRLIALWIPSFFDDIPQ